MEWISKEHLAKHRIDEADYQGVRSTAAKVAYRLWQTFCWDRTTRWSEWRPGLDGWGWVTLTNEEIADDTTAFAVPYKLSPTIVLRHVEGRTRIGVWPGQDRRGWLAFDVDAHDGNERKARGTAREIRKLLGHLGLQAMVCRSGGGHGYHVWVVFDEHLPSDMVGDLGSAVRAVVRRTSSAAIHIPGAGASSIALPMGFNPTTNVWAEWLDARYLRPVGDSVQYFLKHLRRNTRESFFDALQAAHRRGGQRELIAEADVPRKEPEPLPASPATPDAIEAHDTPDPWSLRQRVEAWRTRGLTALETRHKAMWCIARWAYWVERCSVEEVRAELIEFADSKLNGFSRSPAEEIRRDIAAIARSVEQPKYAVGGEVRAADLSPGERAFIATARGRSGETLKALVDYESTFAAKRGGTFFVSGKHIALHIGRTERTVWNHIRQLVDDGLIMIVDPGSDLTGKANEYRVLWPAGSAGSSL